MSTHSVAEKAAQALRAKTQWYAGCGRYVPESELCEAIQAAIEEASAEQQERIDALVEALREAQTCLFMEGYGSSQGRRHHTVMEEIKAALEPFNHRPHVDSEKLRERYDAVREAQDALTEAAGERLDV